MTQLRGGDKVRMWRPSPDGEYDQGDVLTVFKVKFGEIVLLIDGQQVFTGRLASEMQRGQDDVWFLPLA